VDDSPVFVTGLPRTGKTPLRIALGSHPALSMTRKTRMWTTHLDRYGDLSSPEGLDACLAALLDDPCVARLLPDERAIRAEFSRRRPTYANLFGVVHALYARSIGASRWGEQMAGLESLADEILDSWPNAKFIHMVRHPASWIDPGARRRPGRLGSELATWLESARWAIDNRDLHGPNYLLVHYEDMLVEPVQVLRSVGEFIEQEFNFGIGDQLVKALPASGSTMLRGRPAVTSRPAAGRCSPNWVTPNPRPDPGEKGVTDTAAAAWYEMGHGLEAAKDAS
jgi:hypothetical protein